MQHTNTKTIPAGLSQNAYANNDVAHTELEGILVDIEKNTRLIGEMLDAEELFPKNISRNKIALIERIVALQLLNDKSKSNPSQEHWESA